jgi:hypothetical protein
MRELLKSVVASARAPALACLSALTLLVCVSGVGSAIVYALYAGWQVPEVLASTPPELRRTDAARSFDLGVVLSASIVLAAAHGLVMAFVLRSQPTVSLWSVVWRAGAAGVLSIFTYLALLVLATRIDLPLWSTSVVALASLAVIVLVPILMLWRSVTHR